MRNGPFLRLLNDGLNYSQSGYSRIALWLLLLLLRPVTLMTARSRLRSLVHLHVGIVHIIIEVIVDVELIVV